MSACKNASGNVGGSSDPVTVTDPLQAETTAAPADGEQEGSASELGYVSRLFASDRVHTVDIEISAEDWADLTANPTNKTKYKVNITVDGETFESVSFATKGNTSLTSVASDPDSDRYSFKVNFGKYVKGRTYYGLNKLSLNNIYSDASYMKDYISYELFRQTGVDAPLTSYVWLTVNGNDHGLYLAIEDMSESYLERTADGEGELYKPETEMLANMGGGGMPGGNEMPEGMTPPENGQMPEGMTPPQNGQMPSMPGNGEMPSMPQNGQMPSMPGNGEMPSMPQNGQMPSMPGNGEMPSMPQNGQMPSMPGNGEMPSMPQNGEMPSMPGNGEMPSMPGNGQMPEGMTPPENGQTPGGNVFPGGFGSVSSGADLKYTDDNIESYADIFNNDETDASDEDKQRVIAALKGLSEGTDLASVLDTDEIVSYFAAHNFTLNYDSYTGTMLHNYYLYEKDGKLSMLPWDYNLAFGGFSGGSDATTLVNTGIDSPLSGATEDARPMWQWIAESEEYTQAYHQALESLIAGYFESGAFETQIDALYEMLLPYVEKDPSAFYTAAQFTEAYETLKTVCLLRAESIRAQLDGTLASTTSAQKAEDRIDASAVDIGAMGSHMGGGNMGREQKTAAKRADA